MEMFNSSKFTALITHRRSRLGDLGVACEIPDFCNGDCSKLGNACLLGGGGLGGSVCCFFNRARSTFTWASSCSNLICSSDFSDKI